MAGFSMSWMIWLVCVQMLLPLRLPSLERAACAFVLICTAGVPVWCLLMVNVLYFTFKRHFILWLLLPQQSSLKSIPFTNVQAVSFCFFLIITEFITAKPFHRTSQMHESLSLWAITLSLLLLRLGGFLHLFILQRRITFICLLAPWQDTFSSHLINMYLFRGMITMQITMSTSALSAKLILYICMSKYQPGWGMMQNTVPCCVLILQSFNFVYRGWRICTTPWNWPRLCRSLW